MDVVGYIILILWVLFAITGRKRDRRFRNGYKNNEEPMKASTFWKISGVMWVIAILFIGLGSQKKPTKVKEGIEVFSSPDIKSKVLCYSKAKIDFYREGETKYFYKFKFRDSSNIDTLGYILKENVK